MHNTFAIINYTDKEHRIKMTTYFKFHSWLWAQQTQAIDSHCVHMQLWTTTFLFTIFHEDSISENRDNGSFSIISLTEGREALSEGQFVKQTRDTLSGADVRAWNFGIDSYMYWGLYRFFSRTIPQTMIWRSLQRLLCPLVHPKTQHFKKTLWRWHYGKPF